MDLLSLTNLYEFPFDHRPARSIRPSWAISSRWPRSDIGGRSPWLRRLLPLACDKLPVLLIVRKMFNVLDKTHLLPKPATATFQLSRRRNVNAIRSEDKPLVTSAHEQINTMKYADINWFCKSHSAPVETLAILSLVETMFKWNVIHVDDKLVNAKLFLKMISSE